MIHTPSFETYTVGQTNWNGAWNPRPTGSGVAVEGSVQQVRSHTIIDSTGQHHRYQVAVLALGGEVRKRVFNEKGEEVDTQLHSKETFKRFGYLPDYKRVAVNDENVLSFDQLQRTIGDSRGALPAGYYDQQLGQLHPHQPQIFEFWGDTHLMKSVELKKEVKVRLKTKGDSVLVDTITRFDTNMPNYTGEAVGDNWGTKIVTKRPDEVATEEVDDRQGVDDSEWD